MAVNYYATHDHEVLTECDVCGESRYLPEQLMCEHVRAARIADITAIVTAWRIERRGEDDLVAMEREECHDFAVRYAEAENGATG